MKLLAISGGVDSMVLAHKYKNKDIVLAFVNYNFRHDTNIDQKIVENFAKKHNIKLEKLILNGYNDVENNLENWAREVRYKFFKKIYDKYNCSQLLLAHHNDDWIETAIMQYEKNENKLFYGIKRSTSFKSMKIFRPFIFKYWKEQIYQIAKDNNIDYHDDYTNFQTDYQRNKIRNIYLKNKSLKEKENEMKKFILLNKLKEEKINSIKKEYKTWRESKFSINLFKKFNNQNELLIKFINSRLENINLSKNILTNIILFIDSSKKDNKFLLSNQNYLIKRNNRISIIKNLK